MPHIQCVKLISGIAVFTWLEDSEPPPYKMDKCSHEKICKNEYLMPYKDSVQDHIKHRETCSATCLFKHVLWNQCTFMANEVIH